MLQLLYDYELIIWKRKRLYFVVSFFSKSSDINMFLVVLDITKIYICVSSIDIFEMVMIIFAAKQFTNILAFSGIIFCVYSLVSLYKVLVFASLMYGTWPWTAEDWNYVRRDANQLLIDSGIRQKSGSEQFAYMTAEQQADMRKYVVKDKV